MKNQKSSDQPDYVTRKEFLKETAEIKNSISGLDNRVGSLETKVDKLDTGVGSLETKVDKLDTRVGSLETKVEQNTNSINKLAFEMVNVKDRLDKIEDTMFTKSDGQEITNRLDYIVQMFENFDKKVVFHTHRLNDNDTKFADHEARITRLESQKQSH